VAQAGDGMDPDEYGHLSEQTKSCYLWKTFRAIWGDIDGKSGGHSWAKLHVLGRITAKMMMARRHPPLSFLFVFSEITLISQSSQIPLSSDNLF